MYVSDAPSLSLPSLAPADALAVAERHLARLCQALREVVEQGKARAPECSARRLSRTLGHHPGYLSRLFRGEIPIKVETTCELLRLLQIEAGEFFFLTFPLGGEAEAHLRRARNRQEEAVAGPRVRPFGVRRAPSSQPVNLAFWAGWLLRRKIRRSRRTQAALSEELGFGSPYALSNALRGQCDLAFHHVFPVLAALGVGPGRFFAELFLLAVGAGVDDEKRERLLDDLEEASLGGAVAFLAAREEGLGPGEEEPV